MGYKCTLMGDSCGSMKHAEAMAYQMGCDWWPTPVDDQSVNPAEVAIKCIFDATKATLLGARGRIPTRYYHIVAEGCRCTTQRAGIHGQPGL